MLFPWSVAPYEADAQLAYLAQQDFVDLVITEDSDLILYGCKKVRQTASFVRNVVVILMLVLYSFYFMFI